MPTMPSTREKSETSPAWARAPRMVSGSVMSAPLTNRPLAPTMTTACAPASSHRGLRIVLSLRISLAIRDMAAPSARAGDVEKRGLQGTLQPVERAGVAQPSLVDDRDPVDGLGHLAEHMAGEQDRATLGGEVAQ